MRPFTPKIGRHVTYRLPDGRPRSATIRGVTSNDVIDVRIGHSGEVYTGVSRQTADDQVSVWFTSGTTFDDNTVVFLDNLMTEENFLLVSEYEENLKVEAA